MAVHLWPTCPGFVLLQSVWSPPVARVSTSLWSSAPWETPRANSWPSPERSQRILAAASLDLLISVGERVSMTLLAMAIQDLGEPAQSFTGSQSGIITDTHHVAARVLDVKPY